MEWKLSVSRIREAMRASLAGLPSELVPGYLDLSLVGSQPNASFRDPALPPLENLPSFLFAETEHSEHLPAIVNLAGKIAMVCQHGCYVTNIDFEEQETDGKRLWFPSIDYIGNVDLESRISIYAAGLLSESLVWGDRVFWMTSVGDLDEIGRMSRRISAGPVMGAAHVALETTIGVLACAIPSLKHRVSVEKCVEVRDSLPQDAFDYTILNAPSTMKIAEVIYEAVKANIPINSQVLQAEFIHRTTMKCLKEEMNAGQGLPSWPNLPSMMSHKPDVPPPFMQGMR